MDTTQIGRAVVTATIENVFDLYEMSNGTLPAERVRSLEITDALVDTGATYLEIPRSVIDRLGLRYDSTRRTRATNGVVFSKMYGVVRLTVQGRTCHVEVSEIAEGCPVLIGKLPLGSLDFVVDPKRQRLIGNPDHGGEHMIDMF